jgi:uncharacterized protein Usg
MRDIGLPAPFLTGGAMSDHSPDAKKPDHAAWLQKLLTHRLITAEILYHMPDHPVLLQTYVWQDYDLAPKFPVLQKFLDFWEAKLDGKLHSVRVVSARLVSPAEIRAAVESYGLH